MESSLQGTLSASFHRINLERSEWIEKERMNHKDTKDAKDLFFFLIGAPVKYACGSPSEFNGVKYRSSKPSCPYGQIDYWFLYFWGISMTSFMPSYTSVILSFVRLPIFSGILDGRNTGRWCRACTKVCWITDVSIDDRLFNCWICCLCGIPCRRTIDQNSSSFFNTGRSFLPFSR